MTISQNKIKLLQTLEADDTFPIFLARAAIERTKTNRSLEKIEQQYEPKILAVFKLIVKDYKGKEYLLHEARKKYGPYINQVLKSLITKVYLLGMEYIGRAINKPYLLTLEQIDLQTIELQTQTSIEQFWRLLTRYLQVIKNRTLVFPRKQELMKVAQASPTAEEEQEESQNRLLELLTNVKFVLDAIATPILAISTLNGIRKLRTLNLALDDPSGTGKPVLPIGNQYVQFATSRDERVCPICRPLEGRRWNPEDPNIVLPKIGTHPRCILPDTLVDSPSGITTVLRTFYNGPIIQLTFAKNGRISITPNHMFLTPNGFAAADFLNEGDDVINCSVSQEVLSAINPNNNRNPTRISNVFESFSKTFGMASTTMPSTSEYLHGDSIFCNGNIDIIRSDSLLSHNHVSVYSTTNKQINTQLLYRNDPTMTNSFNTLSMITSLLKSLAFASDCTMGFFRQSAPFFSRRLRHTQKHGFTSVSGCDSNIFQSSSYSIPANVKYLRQCLNRFPRIIETDKIIDVNVDRMYAGFVYDLETPSTLYNGNGHILSNCRCRLLLVVDGKVISK